MAKQTKPSTRAAKTNNAAENQPTIDVQGTDLPLVGKIKSPIYGIKYNTSNERFMLLVNATASNPSKRGDGKTVIYLQGKGLEILLSDYGFELSGNGVEDAFMANMLVKTNKATLTGVEVFADKGVVINDVEISEPHVQNRNLAVEFADEEKAMMLAYKLLRDKRQDRATSAAKATTTVAAKDDLEVTSAFEDMLA